MSIGSQRSKSQRQSRETPTRPAAAARLTNFAIYTPPQSRLKKAENERAQRPTPTYISQTLSALWQSRTHRPEAIDDIKRINRPLTARTGSLHFFSVQIHLTCNRMGSVFRLFTFFQSATTSSRDRHSAGSRDGGRPVHVSVNWSYIHTRASPCRRQSACRHT